MEGRGGCCIARYGGARAGGSYDMSKVNRIMLRFRPIAPKPMSTGSGGSGRSSPEMSDVSSCRSGRGKRKRNRSISNSDLNHNNNNSSSSSNKRCNNNKRKCNNKKNNNNTTTLAQERVDQGEVVTLPLLPETPDRKDFPVRSSPVKSKPRVPTGLCFENQNNISGDDYRGQVINELPADPTAEKTSHQTIREGAVTVASRVTVESVADAWVDVDGLGRTDVERKVRLERDTCPGFLSDGYGRVTWTNQAYREMVGLKNCDDQMLVWLVVKDTAKLPVTVGYSSHPRAFTCTVGLQYYTCGSGIGWGGSNQVKGCVTVPCDVWRMDGGGFAWRLDVKTALCLGL